MKSKNELDIYLLSGQVCFAQEINELQPETIQYLRAFIDIENASDYLEAKGYGKTYIIRKGCIAAFSFDGVPNAKTE